MKKFALFLLRSIMRFIYAVMKLLTRPRDRVLFISRRADSAGENFLLIAEEIRKRSPNTELRFSCKKDKSGRYGFSHPFLMLDRMRLLAGSKVCITESGTAELSILRHREELRIIQIWHSMAPFKKFGWQIVGLENGIAPEVAEGVRLHEGYDYVIVGSDYVREMFSEALNTESSKVLSLGLPVTDELLDTDGEKDRFKLWKLHPSTCGKKIVVYAPTMRKKTAVPCGELISAFDYENTTLVVKLHPKDRNTVIDDDRVVVDTEMTIQEAIRAADIIVTDYSGVSAEASLMGKPVYFYTPDIDGYAGKSGLNINPAELFPSITFSSAEELVREISLGEHSEDSQKIRVTLADACKGDSARSIAYLATETSIQNTEAVVKKIAEKGSKFSNFLARCKFDILYLGSRIDPMLLLFESKQTGAYDGAVRELYEAMLADKKYENCRFAWAVSDPDEAQIPGVSPLLIVKYGSDEHMQVHARSRAIISDAPPSERVKIRPEQHYLVADGDTKELLRRLVD